MQTVSNQRVIKTHKEKYSGNFLQIKKDYLKNAYKTLESYSALYFYLNLAANKDKYNFAFSPKAILEDIGMPESTCRKAFDLLVQRGFLVRKGEKSNIYDFYETPYGKGFLEEDIIES